ELERVRKEAKRPSTREEADFTIVDRQDDVILVEAKAVKGGPLRDLSDRLRQQEKAHGAIVASLDDGAVFLVVNFDESLGASGLAELARIVREEAAERVVVGLPLTMRGAHGEQAAETERFADALRGVLEVPVELFDERFTTDLAQRTAGAAPEDALAAAHLL